MRLTVFLALLMLAGIAGLGRHLYVNGWSADEIYRRAERCYQVGDFEKAQLGCEKALRRDPRHAPSRALFMEIQFILGQGKISPAPPGYDQYMPGPGYVRYEIDHAFARGERAADLGDVEQARKEYRKILEYAKWLPGSPDLLARAQEARVRLDGLR